ncbi:MAG TPA: hypothetical protein VGQ52_08770 [Gemmatimonadaceae bacterium]|jgi:hypothetical protein|nr:hypothetical protein [Gemmatimonadaceae bacterium]
MAYLKGALLLSVTLAAGVVIGVSYERYRTPAHNAASVAPHDVMSHFTRELGLDSAQQRAIAAIFARRQEAVDSTWHTLQPHVREALHLTLQEIVPVLRPDQLAKYRQMVHARHPGVLP